MKPPDTKRTVHAYYTDIHINITVHGIPILPPTDQFGIILPVYITIPYNPVGVRNTKPVI